jgi:CheY-like chemotaxis protein
VKFTDTGGHISIRITSLPNEVRVAITDTGIGIAAEFLPQVFQRFKQADPSAARRHGGLGLGLALVRELVHLHGGSVDAESAGLQAGTTFTVILPVPVAGTIARRESRPPQRKSVLSGIHILIVEDDADAREIVSTTVADAGASVTAVGSVAEALGTLRDNRGERPDVVVADIGLPGADGYTLISEIRCLPPEEGGRLPVIAVTAYATAEDRRTALGAGFFAHIPKPFAPENLVSTIARAVEPTV